LNDINADKLAHVAIEIFLRRNGCLETTGLSTRVLRR
jgi:hypothetical protein